ncbi:hypothetical protein GP486_000309 [Trichoglossum hirsutum]|uniref:Uncharacterized protein n=1 Tax=Trichoglossum hirsutum TaxID=265104 RepID=A0A9P8LJ65_9PEZI|nr:hypothetical protein GP486_000309 [Trichoglossum hirsutum]
MAVDGVQPSTYKVRMAISQDGRDRALQWALANEGGAVVRVDNRIIDHTHAVLDVYAGVKQAGTVRRVSGSASHQRARLNDSKGTLESKSRSSNSWLVRLKDGEEAKRFVRAWNRRPFPLSDGGSASDEPPSMVKAEVVW